MYFHNIVYIKCPYCRFSIEVDSSCTSCHLCGGTFNSLETYGLKHKNTGIL